MPPLHEIEDFQQTVVLSTLVYKMFGLLLYNGPGLVAVRLVFTMGSNPGNVA